MSEQNSSDAVRSLFQLIEAKQGELATIEYTSRNWSHLSSRAYNYGFRESYTGESCEGYIRAMRRHVAARYRDEVFTNALRLAFADNSLPVPPPQGNDPESDLKLLLGWCIEFKRANNKSRPSELPLNVSGTESTDVKVKDQDDFKLAKWFEDNTPITGSSLRKAVSEGKFLRTVGTPRKKRYSLTDAKVIWGSEIIVKKA